MRDGRLEAIFRRWKMWNDDQRNLYARVTADESGSAPQTQSTAAQLSVWDATLRYLPSLLTAAVITLVLSVLSMALAIVVGVLIASGRVYGPAPVKALLTGWVELIRGTPLLLQLFVIYYGLATVVQLPAFLAALIGLGLNYGAYESEIYRSALESVPPGQLDAARTLGFSDRQTLMLIRGPQALRLALAPMTNDFVALLKDSSLVSLITVVELTKQTTIFASNIGTWFVPRSVVRGAVSGVVPAGVASRPTAGAYVAAGHERPRRSRSRGATWREACRTRCLAGRHARRDPGGHGRVRCREDQRVARGSGTRPDCRGERGRRWPAAGPPDPCRAARRFASCTGGVGMVFQFHHLFEHLTALHNVWLALVHVQRQAQPEASASTRAARPSGRRRQSGCGAARAVRRRGSTCGDCPGPGRRPTAAPDGRAHGVA
jgi:polar amino acid transport system substrate-binding protein